MREFELMWGDLGSTALTGLYGPDVKGGTDTLYTLNKSCQLPVVCQRWEPRHMTAVTLDPSGVIFPTVFVFVSSTEVNEAALLMVLEIKA